MTGDENPVGAADCVEDEDEDEDENGGEGEDEDEQGVGEVGAAKSVLLKRVALTGCLAIKRGADSWRKRFPSLRGVGEVGGAEFGFSGLSVLDRICLGPGGLAKPCEAPVSRVADRCEACASSPGADSPRR